MSAEGVFKRVRPLLLLVSLGFIAYLAWDSRDAISSLRSLRPLSLIGAFLLLFVALAATARLWLGLIDALSGRRTSAHRWHLLRSFTRSWIARYLPGSAWSQGARLLYTDRAVATRGAVAFSMVDEFTLTAGSAATLGLGLLAWTTVGVFAGMSLLVVGTLSTVLLVHRLRRVLHLTAGIVGRILPSRFDAVRDAIERGLRSPQLDSMTAVRFTLGYFGLNVAGGSAFALVVVGMGADVSAGGIPLLIGAHSLAFLVGLVAVFAPAGLGVREVMLAVLVSGVVPGETAALAALSLRALSILVDVLFFALVEIVAHRQAFRSRVTPLD